MSSVFENQRLNTLEKNLGTNGVGNKRGWTRNKNIGKQPKKSQPAKKLGNDIKKKKTIHRHRLRKQKNLVEKVGGPRLRRDDLRLKKA